MSPNAKQTQKFARFSKDLNMEVNDYVAHYSKEYIDRLVKNISEITEDEATKWVKIAEKLPAHS